MTGAPGSADALRASQGSAEAGRVSQPSTGGVAQATDAPLARVSQQDGTGSMDGAPGSVDALRAPQGGAQAGRVSQQSAGGVPQAADASLARASQQSNTGSAAAAPSSAEALRASQGSAQGVDTMFAPPVSSAPPADHPSQMSAGGPVAAPEVMAAGGVMSAPGEAGRASRRAERRFAHHQEVRREWTPCLHHRCHQQRPKLFPSLAVCPSNPQEESHRQQTHHSLEPHNRAAQAPVL